MNRDLVRVIIYAAVDGVCWSIPILALLIVVMTAQDGILTP